jgi:hypothetical protein
MRIVRVEQRSELTRVTNSSGGVDELLHRFW